MRGWGVTTEQWLACYEPAVPVPASASDESAATAKGVRAVDWQAESIIDGAETKGPAKPAVAAPVDLVPVTPGALGKARCGLCLEPMQESFVDDLEDWFYVDAVRGPNNAVWHAHCAADAKVAHLRLHIPIAMCMCRSRAPG